MLAQQRPQLVLKTNLAMMLLLSGGVLLHLFEIGLAHGKICITTLPLKVGVIATAFFHPFRLRDGAPEPREQMDVIFHAADLDGRAIELFGNPAEIRMERVARGFVAQERPAVFGGEDQMNVNGGKGLWHDGRMANCGGIFQSQRRRAGASHR